MVTAKMWTQIFKTAEHKPQILLMVAWRCFQRCFVLAGRSVGGSRSRRLCCEEHEPARDSPQHQHRRHQYQSAEPLPVLSGAPAELCRADVLLMQFPLHPVLLLGQRKPFYMCIMEPQQLVLPHLLTGTGNKQHIIFEFYCMQSTDYSSWRICTIM